MVAQTALPFKLEITNDTLTPHAGLALFGEYCHAHRLAAFCSRQCSCPFKDCLRRRETLHSNSQLSPTVTRSDHHNTANPPGDGDADFGLHEPYG